MEHAHDDQALCLSHVKDNVIPKDQGPQAGLKVIARDAEPRHIHEANHFLIESVDKRIGPPGRVTRYMQPDGLEIGLRLRR